MSLTWDSAHEGAGIDNLASAAAGATFSLVALAIDLTNNKIWARASGDSTGDWNASGTANPATNTGGFDITSVNSGTVYLAYSGFYTSSVADTVTLNAGASTFHGSIPSGFSAWDATGGTTWNASDNSNLTLSNGNLTASAQTSASTWRSIRANNGKTTGKWYVEIIISNYDASNGIMPGVMNGSGSLTNYIGVSNNGCGYQVATGTCYKNGSSLGSMSTSFGFSAWRTIRGQNLGLHSGKYYIEVVANSISDAGVGWAAGICNATATLNDLVGQDASGNNAGFQSNRTYQYQNGGTSNVLPAAVTAGDTLCLAIDLTNNRLWGRVNGGTWSGSSGNPATNTGGEPISTVNDGSSVMLALSGFGAVTSGTGALPGDKGTISISAAFSIPSGFSYMGAATNKYQGAVTIISAKPRRARIVMPQRKLIRRRAILPACLCAGENHGGISRSGARPA